jgi:hypothetical protein
LTHNNKKYDIEKGLLLKLDSFLQIQLGTVYRGLTRVSDDEVLSLYRNRIIPVKYVEGDKQNVSEFNEITLKFIYAFLLLLNAFAGTWAKNGSTCRLVFSARNVPVVCCNRVFQ